MRVAALDRSGAMGVLHSTSLHDSPTANDVIVRAKASGVAHFGRIDRRSLDGCSQLDANLYACDHRPVNGYRSRDAASSDASSPRLLPSIRIGWSAGVTPESEESWHSACPGRRPTGIPGELS
jgi:hypothetical protein